MTNNVQTPGGNTTTAGAVEQLAMARRIAADTARAQGFANRPQIFLDGRWDNHASVQAALAAIIETSARVAELEAENDRLSKAVGGGLLGDLLANDEKDEFVKFIKFLRGQKAPQP